MEYILADILAGQAMPQARQRFLGDDENDMALGLHGCTWTASQVQPWPLAQASHMLLFKHTSRSNAVCLTALRHGCKVACRVFQQYPRSQDLLGTSTHGHGQCCTPALHCAMSGDSDRCPLLVSQHVYFIHCYELHGPKTESFWVKYSRGDKFPAVRADFRQQPSDAWSIPAQCTAHRVCMW